tara:strand:+ start:725 stop:919 length:195 start_codon:yes stop_codon:yes gene_type:complete
MPYKLVKVNGGYKVGLRDGGKMSNGRYHLSNKPMTKTKATYQMKAVENSEKGKMEYPSKAYKKS